jgi:hypothetical protein
LATPLSRFNRDATFHAFTMYSVIARTKAEIPNRQPPRFGISEEPTNQQDQPATGSLHP